MTAKLTKEQRIVRDLSDQLVELQKPIRILNDINWSDDIKLEFFKNKCQKLPAIDADYYLQKPLSYNPDELIDQFHKLIRAIKNQMGQYSDIGTIMTRLCNEYSRAIEMLKARGTPKFSEIAKDLYGSPDDAFYPNGPRLSELGTMLGNIFQILVAQLENRSDEKKYSAQEAVTILQGKLAEYFHDKDHISVTISDTLVADAAAGSDCLRLRSDAKFSDNDLRYLEVHEGWVHIGTTLNGMAQPICTFLAKGSPTSSITQEGLAVITEIFTFSSFPERMLKISNRVRALELANQGADFVEVFRFFKEQGLSDDDSYNYSVRVFRGSTPQDGPFTKDLSYTKGFVLIYNYIRLAVSQGLVDRIPLFFLGKTLIEDIPTLYELKNQGMIADAKYIPPQFRNLASLSSWMGFSLYLNKFDLDQVANHYGYLFRK